MSLKKEASFGHLIVGAILVAISLVLAIVQLFHFANYFGLLIHFFGVWGGVEIGRYVESKIQKKPVKNI